MVQEQRCKSLKRPLLKVFRLKPCAILFALFLPVSKGHDLNQRKRVVFIMPRDTSNRKVVMDEHDIDVVATVVNNAVALVIYGKDVS